MKTHSILGALLCAFLIVTLVSCGGSTITETLTPGETFDEQIRLLNPFALDDPDANGITGSAVIDGVALEEDGYPTITAPVGQEEIKVSFAITGHGFIQSGGQRETSAITDLFAIIGEKQEPLCTAKTSVAGLPDVSSRLDMLREAQETIRIEDLRQAEDREVELAITLKADPIVAQHVAGNNLGIEPIPAERRVEIEHKRNHMNSVLGLVGGFILGALTGDVITPAKAVCEIACGDPVVVLHAKLLIEGYGEEPGPAPTPYLTMSGPSQAEAGDDVTIIVNTNCPDWRGMVHGEVVYAGSGNGQFILTMPDEDLVVIVAGCGMTRSHTVTLILPAENLPPVASFTAAPTQGNAPLTVHADGSASHDPDGFIVEYRWYFYGGGGTCVAGNILTRDNVYTVPGDYSIWLVVVDNDGATDWSDEPVAITVTEPVEPVTYTLFVSGTDGPLVENGTLTVFEGTSKLLDKWELHGSDSSKIPLNRNDVQITTAELPIWVFSDFVSRGEIATVYWANPDDPDPEEPGNIFIEPGTYEVSTSIAYDSQTYTRNWSLAVQDRPDFP